MESVFEHLPQYRILRCKKCRYAVVPAQASAHLANQHPLLTRAERRVISEAVDCCSSLASVRSEVIFPCATDGVVPGFPVWHDGLRCQWKGDQGAACEFICRSLYRIQEHCKTEHDWINVQRQGGDKRSQKKQAPNKLWAESRTCQQFFRVPGWKRYFEVDHDCPSPTEENLVCAANTVDVQVSAFFRRQEASIRQAENDVAEAANIVQGFDDHRSSVVPWLRTTGIVDHISGLKKDEIRGAVALPSEEEEPVLCVVLEQMGEMLQEAHKWCFDGPECMLTWPCRVVLSRFQSVHADTNGQIRAFDPYKEAGTLKSYFKIAKQFLAYFDRVAAGREYYFSSTTVEGPTGARPEDVIELSAEQQGVWRSIRRGARQQRGDDLSDDAIRNQLLRLWLLLICHETGARRYRSPLVSFCAMLSIKSSDSCWMEPGDFNSHLSAMIWVVQLLIFYDSARQELQGNGPTIDLVKSTCEKYLQQTNETPMGELLRWRLLLFRISKDEVKTRQATWDESEQVLTYEDTELHMDQIPALLLSEYRECRRLLYQDLMFGADDVRRVHSWDLKDNADVHTVDWSFLQHRDNGTLLGGSERALLSEIERSPRLRETFLAEDREVSGSFTWRESALASYEAAVQQYLHRLSALIHISAGTPVRESEFMSMTWRNTQRPRSISIRHGRVMIHLTYHKSQQQSGKGRDNIRFLAHSIGDLLLDYLVYVMRLRQLFIRHKSPKSPKQLLSPFLWEKDCKVWPEGKLSRCLEAACVRAQIPRLHISNWRQMTVAIVKTKFASDIGCFEIDPNDEDGEEMEADIKVLTRQRNHKTRTVNRAYANQTGANFGNVWDGLIRMGLRASNLWQDFWGVETILTEKKRKWDDGESRMVKRVARGIYRPKKAWSADALLGGMRKLYGDERLDWKSSDQERALTTIMSWTEQLVIVLPTGAGKTALIMVPCTLPDAGITVLVVPLVSLRTDLLRRIQDLGIDHLEWFPGERREASLTIVSVEAASTTDFLRYAQSLVTQQKLDRIVIDECHLTVTAAEYRPSIVDLANIRSLRTQFVYLTATLPPSMQQEFEERNYLSRPMLIRSSCNRPNIFYMVRRATSGKGTLLQQVATEARDTWEKSRLLDHARDKIIMYVRTRDEARELSEILDCDSYTADCGGSEEKKAILTTWVRTAKRPYIVATTALAEGFDYPHVRFVINVNEPDSLVMFAQESGRAGRDGLPAYSLVLLPATWSPREDSGRLKTIPGSIRQDVSLRKYWERYAVHRYLRGEQCFRMSLSEYLDTREERRWCMDGDVACDVCKVTHPVPIELPQDAVDERPCGGLEIIQRQQLIDQSELATYKENLAAIRGTCILCRALDQCWDHSFGSCTWRHAMFEQRSRARQRHQEKGKRWLQAFTGCFWCLQPQTICQRAEKGGGCEFGDVVLPLCYGVYRSVMGRSWLRRGFGRDFATVESFFDWVGEETIFAGSRAVQGVRVASRKLREM